MRPNCVSTMLKRIAVILSIILALCFFNGAVSSVSAQTNTLPGTYGNEFWLGFMMNANVPIEKEPKLYVYAVAEEQMTVIVALGTTGAQLATIEIPAGGGVGFTPALTAAAIYPKADEADQNKYNRGLRIYATDKKKKFTCYAVSETMANTENSTRDATILLPTEVLGKEYFVQTYPEDGVATEFLVVATEDATEVTVVPTVMTEGDHTAGNPFSMTLNKGQTLMVKSKEKVQTSLSMDLSGTSVCADKPVAVFNGNVLTKIPNRGAYSANHTFEQLLPQTMWGKEFFVTLAAGTKRNMVQVTASVDGTQVTVNMPGSGTQTITLDRGESLTDPLLLQSTSPIAKITATEPVVCYHYLTCGAANQEDTGTDLFDWGNPTNALVIPWTHRTKEMSFYTAKITNYNEATARQKYYVQVIINSADKNKLKLDGLNVSPSLFTNFSNDGSKAYACIPVPTPNPSQPNVKHRLETTGSGFVGYVYGMTSEARAYEYTLGFNPPTYPDSLFVRDRDNPNANIMSPYSYGIDSVKGKAWYQRQLEEWPIGQERLDTAYICNGTWLRFLGQMAPQNSSDSVMWKIYKCNMRGVREKNPVAAFHTENAVNHFYQYQFSVDKQEDRAPELRDPFQIYAVDCERYKKHLICTDLDPDCDTLRTMVKVLRAYNDTTWRVVCENDTVHFFKHNEHMIGPGLNDETIFQFDYTGSDPKTLPFYKGHNIWTRRYTTPNGCDSIVTLCIFGCDTSFQKIDTTVCEKQLQKMSNGTYSIIIRDKNNHNRSFFPLTVHSQADLLAEARQGGIMPYSQDKVAAQRMMTCLDVANAADEEERKLIEAYRTHCPDFLNPRTGGCWDSVKLHLTIMPTLYYPAYVGDTEEPELIPWCTDGDPNAVYDLWTRADGTPIRTIKQTDPEFNDPNHLNIGYFRDTVWHDPCPNCPNGKCPKEINSLILLKVDNEPQVHPVHICRDETYTHSAFMAKDQKVLKGWELWEQGYNETNYYEETHGVDVKDAQGVTRCQYMETLQLYIHPSYEKTGNFNTELRYKDTTCIARDPATDHYEWLGHEGQPGEIHYVWDVTRRQRVEWNNIPTDKAGTFEFVDSLKTKTCTECRNTEGCDSIWRLTLIVGPEKHDTMPYVLCRNKMVSYTWQNETYYYYGHLYEGPEKTDPNAKEIDDTQYLNTSCSGDKYFYETFSGKTRYRCDSTWTVKIHLDSTYVHSIDTFICEGTEYHFFNKTYTWTYDHTPGATNIHVIDSLVQTPTCGCDSGVTHYVHVRPVYNIAEAPDTTCQAEGAFYEWVNHPKPGDALRQIWLTDILRGGKKPVMSNAIPLDVAGTFYLEDSLRTVTCDECHGKNGCDSVVSIKLVIIPTYDLEPVNRPLSSESYFLWDDTLFMGSPTAEPPSGVTYNYLVRVPGTAEYTHHYHTTQTVNGESVGTYECDSLFTYRIVVGQVFRDTAYAAVCENCEYEWFIQDPKQNCICGKTIIITDVPAAGETRWYYDSLKTSLGFDSIYNLQLTGNPTKYNSEEASICQGERFVWDGHSNKGGEYLYLINNGEVTRIDTATFNRTISQLYGHYTVRDSLLTDTTFVDPKTKLVTPIHCDSIWELELDVHPTYNSHYNYDRVLFTRDLCSNDTLLWNFRLWVGYDYDLAAHPIEPASPTTPYDSIIYIPRAKQTGFYDSVPSLTGTRNFRCDSINYLQIEISKYDTTWVRENIGDNATSWYFGGKGGTFRYRDNLGNVKDRVTCADLLRDIPLPEGAVVRDTFLIDTLRLNGCDSIIWDSIFIYKTYEFTKDTTICSNIPWSWRPESPNAERFHNINYKTSGTYYDSLKTVSGAADSVYVLHLDIQPAARHTVVDSLCKNDTISWEHQTVYYKPSEVEVEVHYSTGAECDSVMALRASWFDYHHFKPDTIDTICRYADVVWITPGETTPHTMALRGEKGERFDKVPTDTIMTDPRTGKDIGFWMTIYDSLRTVTCNCDSTYTLRYYVRPAYHFHEQATICSSDTFYWRGMELFSPEAATMDTADRYMMHDGTCDSVYFLTLHVNQAYDSIFYDTICANQRSFEWQGHVLDDWLAVHKNDTLPVDTFLWRDFETTLDCDSLYKLYLTVWPIITDTIKDTICVGETYDLNGRPLTKSGIYYDALTNKFGCDSFVVLYLEVVPVTQFKVEPLIVCADQDHYEMSFTFDSNQGIAPHEVRIAYDSLAKAWGFPKDTLVLPVVNNATSLALELPGNEGSYTRPNHYSARIFFDNGTCEDPEKLTVDFKFQVSYPDWIVEQHWMDALGILNADYNNGEGNEGYTFSSYQWYKNGEELIGQTRPYLYLPHLLEPGAEYSVGLVREGEDVSVMTCPVTAVQRDNDLLPQLPYVSVVPTYVVKANPVVNILCSKQGGTYKLYNPFGSLIQSGRFEPGEHNAYEVKLPAQSGVYMFQLNQDEGEVRTVKVIVN